MKGEHVESSEPGAWHIVVAQYVTELKIINTLN